MNDVPTFPGAYVENAPFGRAGSDSGRIPLVRQYLRIMLRWRYVILGSVAACLLVGIIATLLVTRQYTAVTTIEIARESNKITDIQGVERDASIADQEFYQTQYGLLKSKSLSERVAADLKLIDDPKFFERFGGNPARPEFALVGGRYPVAGRAERQRIAGAILLAHVKVAPTRLSRLVDIRFTSPDPTFSAKVANAWATSYIQASLERRFQATSYARKFLESRLGQLRDRLEGSERQLVGYATNQRIINIPSATQNGDRTVERPLVVDDLAALNGALAQATADRVQAEARYDQGGRAGGASTEGLRNVAINNLRQKRAELAADYQRLMTQFEPAYPAARAVQSQIDQIDKSIAREEERVTGSFAADYREALEREAGLKRRVDALKSDLLDLRGRSIQYNIFQREVDTNRQLYDGLLQRYKEIGVAGGVGVNNVSVVDPADVPTGPSSPKLVLNMLIALLAGLGIGAVAALALEHMDEAIADPDEVQRELGLPLLGTVPKLTEGSPKNALMDRKSEMVDAYLAIQTNLAFTTAHGVPKTLMVTSTRPAEGKSTTAMALATMMARNNRRVVLVDGDMRSPSVHHLGGVSHDYGLSNLLAGAEDIESALFQMSDLGFAALSAGPIPPNAAELLVGDRLSHVLDRLLERFDHVVIDSPPVMGLADSPLIANRVEGVVFAVESHGIRTSLVRTALARLAAANARVFGGVLTKFEARKAHLGYGYDYGYGYGRETGRDDA